MQASGPTAAKETVPIKERIKSADKLKSTLTPWADPPDRALVELTNGCNHACIFCKNSHQGRRAKFLSIDTYTSFVEQAVALGLKEIGLYATGEPFMSKRLADYIEIAKNRGVGRVYLTSNGAMATLDKVQECHEAGLDSIKYSINASNAEDYKLVHGFDDFDTVVKNVTETYEWKMANNIQLEMLGSCVMIPALGDIEEAHGALFSPMLDDILYVAASSQSGQAFELIEEIGVSPHGVFNNMDQPLNESSIKPCAMVWNRYHLTAEGYLTACCVDYELDLVFSDLNKQPLAEGWNNEHAKQLRAAHINKKLDGLLCHQCMLNKKLPHKPLTDVAKSQKSELIKAKELKHLKERVVYTSSIGNIPIQVVPKAANE